MSTTINLVKEIVLSTYNKTISEDDMETKLNETFDALFANHYIGFSEQAFILRECLNTIFIDILTLYNRTYFTLGIKLFNVLRRSVEKYNANIDCHQVSLSINEAFLLFNTRTILKPTSMDNSFVTDLLIFSIEKRILDYRTSDQFFWNQVKAAYNPIILAYLKI